MSIIFSVSDNLIMDKYLSKLLTAYADGEVDIITATIELSGVIRGASINDYEACLGHMRNFVNDGMAS